MPISSKNLTTKFSENTPNSESPSKTTATTLKIDPNSSERFINRELSWLAFNERVLREAETITHPLMEQLRFLAISANNLNEFYMVRVAGLRGQVSAGVELISQDGLSPHEQLRLVNRRAGTLMRSQQKCWARITKDLVEEGIEVVEPTALSISEKRWLRRYFKEKLFSVLSPIAIDPAHPFPFLPNLGFSMVLTLQKKRQKAILNALVPLPHLIERFILLPSERHRFIALENVIGMSINKLFPGFKVLEVGLCRVLRDSDIEIEEEAEDLVRLYESALKVRRLGSVIRLTINGDMSPGLRKFLIDGLGAEPETVFALDSLLGLADTKELISKSRAELMFDPFTPRLPEHLVKFNGDCFEAILNKDFIVHHPYDSFDVVIQFLTQAAQDPNVIAIKQTLYRTSDNSPIIAALIDAAEAGKSVTALVELKARFDEERNIRWARDLKRAGVQVVYGFINLKTHAKISYVVRREGNQHQTYCHWGTGNYHPITAQTYTDISLFTCNPKLSRDAAKLFNYTTGTAGPEKMELLTISPFNLRNNILQLVENEINHAENDRNANIWVKMNSLVDGEVIDALYRASQAGVKIKLLIRGICCLRPGVKGLSDNIRVQSLVGRYLEHGRIICFGNGEALPSQSASVFISSADWMPRNLYRRVETLVPIVDRHIHRDIQKIMTQLLQDKAQSWILTPKGKYRRLSRHPLSFNAQDSFMNS